MNKILFLNVALLSLSLSIVSFASAPKPAATATNKGTKPAIIKAPDTKENAETELSQATKKAKQDMAERVNAISVLTKNWSYPACAENNHIVLLHIATLLEAQGLAYHSRFDALEREIASLKAELAAKK